jgi:N-carbamoylputrescine amidase
MMHSFKAAVTQTINQYKSLPTNGEEILACRDAIWQKNLEHNISLIQDAHSQGVRVVCLGEFFTTPYFPLEKASHWLGFSESVEGGPTVQCLRAVSADLEMVIVAPIFEHDPFSGKRYSTAVILQDGKVLGRYRKRHIPNGLNEQGGFFEAYYIESSHKNPHPDCSPNGYKPVHPVYQTRYGRIGVLICYDRHFPREVMQMAEQEVDLVFCPSVTFGKDSERLWEKEFEVDAARFCHFIGASNRSGREAPWNIDFFGNSLFMGPNGRLNNLSQHPNLVVAEIDLASLRSMRPGGWDMSANWEPAARPTLLHSVGE